MNSISFPTVSKGALELSQEMALRGRAKEARIAVGFDPENNCYRPVIDTTGEPIEEQHEESRP